MAASIIQEYYKVQDHWGKADKNKDWKLAIWIVDFHDVEIVSGFMGIEASPLGKFDDIFFHFTTEYKGDDILFEKALYHEYLSWFERVEGDMDMMAALRNDSLLVSDYQPDKSLEPCAENLWKELLRLKSCIRGLESSCFCVYFQLPGVDAEESGGWYKDVLKRGIPAGIRLVTIDYKDKRKVRLQQSSRVLLLEPELNMPEAINNELNKGGFNTNTVGPEGRYRKQVLAVLSCSQHGKSAKLEKEIALMLSVAKEMGSLSAFIGSYLIASQAFFYVKEEDKSLYYADKTLAESEKLMAEGDNGIYPLWRGAMMLKAAMYVGMQKRNKAIELYRAMAVEATKRADAFFIMEGYRLAGHLYYELSQYEDAFENTLLALAGGSYLEKDVIRQSTFLQAANLSLHLAEKHRSPGDVEVIKDQLKEWIGEDWESLVNNEIQDKSKIRHKASLLKRVTNH